MNGWNIHLDQSTDHLNINSDNNCSIEIEKHKHVVANYLGSNNNNNNNNMSIIFDEYHNDVNEMAWLLHVIVIWLNSCPIDNIKVDDEEDNKHSVENKCQSVSLDSETDEHTSSYSSSATPLDETQNWTY